MLVIQHFGSLKAQHATRRTREVGTLKYTVGPKSKFGQSLWPTFIFIKQIFLQFEQ